MKKKVSFLLVVFALVALSAQAGSITIRVGQYSPYGESDLWVENTETFNVLVDDFDFIFGGAEFTVELNEFVDLAFGVDVYSRRVNTHYREFVRDDGTEIRQEMRLSVVPLTSGLRFLPLGKFRVVSPYITGGFGLYPYVYIEDGEFIDFATFDIYGARFRDSGVGWGGYAGAGVEVTVQRGFLVFGEYRRHWVYTQHGGDFWDFGDFDLDARQIAFGFTFRF